MERRQQFCLISPIANTSPFAGCKGEHKSVSRALASPFVEIGLSDRDMEGERFVQVDG